jgi:hypothetical protein
MSLKCIGVCDVTSYVTPTMSSLMTSNITKADGTPYSELSIIEEEEDEDDDIQPPLGETMVRILH